MRSDPSERRPVILVAEGDGELRSSIVTVLVRHFPGAEVRDFADAQTAGDAVRRERADVILADADLSGDGLSFLGELRRDGALSRPYAILLTDATAPEQLLSAIAVGADDCVLKPVRAGDLAARVTVGLRRLGEARRRAELEHLRDRHAEFLSVVSHEIRTPLSAILSAANVLMRYAGERPESVERFARVIHQEGRRLTRLINNQLDLARIESGQTEWVFSPTAVDELVRDVEESFRALVGERNLALEIEPWPEPVVATLDRDKITQVVVNLVSNSIRQSPDGAAVRLRYRPLGGGGVRLEVEDLGGGIPPGREEEIFGRFQQLAPDDRRHGTGLGLTISRQIVDHHGGRIWAEPRRDRGALFVVELPEGAGGRVRDGSV